MEHDYNFYAQRYGQKYADLIESYIERKSASPLICPQNLFKEELKEIGEDMINSQAELNREFDYAAGLRDGIKHAEELKVDKGTIHNISEYVMNKDFTVMLDFHDNDFGLGIENAAKEYANVYNGLISQINIYTNANASTDGYKKRLEAIEDINLIAKFISTAYIAHNILLSLNDIGRFSDMTEQRDTFINNIRDKGQKYDDYLGLENVDNYRIGTYAEIEEYVMEHYKEQQSTDRGEGQNLKTCWLNGEVLFMSVINGEMKVWIQ